MSQKEVLKKAFLSGAELTARQIRGVYKIASPAKVVSRLRMQDGLPVISSEEYNNGRYTQKFRIGKVRYDVIVKGYEALLGAPSTAVLAAGFRAVSK